MNIGAVLRSEISRLARKELKAETSSLRKQVAQHRSQLAAVKRQLQALERQVKATAKVARTGAGARTDESESERKFRFRAGGFANLRRRLGISAETMGELLGVTGQSVYKWESGKARPRARQLEAIASLRGIGKKEAYARIERLRAQ